MIWLKFYIAKGVLAGQVGPQFVRMSAVSGGGGGSHRKNEPIATHAMQRWDWRVVNNPAAINTRVKCPFNPHGLDQRRGGPIPPGPYQMKNPFTAKQTLNEAQLRRVRVRLERDPSTLAGRPANDPEWGRSTGYCEASGLEIHNTGELGSNGCIVPLFGDFMNLVKLMKQFAGAGYYLGPLDVYKDL